MPHENLYTPGCIRTVSGQYVNIANPDPDTILITDIAWGLANQCRFGAQLPVFYTVAQHSWEVAARVPFQDEFSALMHDASEAYILDLPSPVKRLVHGYDKLESNLMMVVAGKFGFDWPLFDSVKQADKEQLEHEWKNYMLGGITWDTYSRENAYACFLTYFNLYCRREHRVTGKLLNSPV